MEIAICGKPSSGKSSFFKAATMIDVPISSRPFTTIKPNTAISYVTAECPCKELKIKCNPRNSHCVNGTRLIPIKLWDLPGIIKGAHEGHGLGLEFLNNIIQADMLIHIVDASGKTDAEGNACEEHDPSEDVKFLENEINLWFESVIKRNIEKIKDENKAASTLAGLGIKEKHVKEAIEKVGLNPEELAKELRRLSKPILIAANKIDLPEAEKNLEKIRKQFPNLMIIPCSAEAEIALRTAGKAGFIDYISGSKDFAIKKELNDKQQMALNLLKEKVLNKYGSTGIQNCLNKAVFEFLKYIAVYPVENEHKFSSKKGDVLPDVYLMPPNSTALDLAFKVHTDIGKHFIGAIDARTGRKVGGDHILKYNDIIKILIH